MNKDFIISRVSSGVGSHSSSHEFLLEEKEMAITEEILFGSVQIQVSSTIFIMFYYVYRS